MPESYWEYDVAQATIARCSFRFSRPFSERHIQADILRIPAGGGALHVERFGHGGQSVLLIHGFPTSSFLWRAIAPRLAESGHTALAIDLLGYGE